ncbi:MAG TPA: DNA (cytosine-5-)-methyltransferase [Candidatus Saccharibacteria bacterium]|nr:DNA (cytosine-5-)-methyltransferase [Candidatus Saccharibacteria bacterium]
MKNLKVVELFAGVGGFRIGLENANNNRLKFKTIWANQWEPSTTRQHASEIYTARFGKSGFSGINIEKVIEDHFESIPNHDLLVGGFPCQDYSVASTLKRSRGLIGKKGVLFWSIYTILKRKGEHAPDYIFLENVDRLLKSPAKQRGKDFAVMLAALSDLGYAIEWRVINAADYGLPQRRRRVFILGYKKGTKLYKKITSTSPKEWLVKKGVLADAFPVGINLLSSNIFSITGKIPEISKTFSSSSPKISPFETSGLIIERQVFTAKTVPKYEGKYITLAEIIIDEKDVPAEYFIDESKLSQWVYLKGAKNEQRTTSSGHTYFYTEGPMTFPDALDKPSRTIITGEGGSGASRFKHVIKTGSGRYRRLTPIELERLNMFPDNHTYLEGVSDTKRAFIMGNALVVGAISRVGESLAKQIN